MKDFKLRGSVGNMMENQEKDVFSLKDALYHLGFRKDSAQNGIIEQETDDAIKGFQKAKGLKVDGYLVPGGETERAIKESARIEILNKPKWANALEVNIAQDRKRSIIDDTPARFGIRENFGANGREPLHELGFASEVSQYEELINKAAQKQGVDPDLVKAIAYMETTHGQYDRIKEAVDINETLRPMNIHAEYWKDLGYDREGLKNPENNIDAGTKIIKSISDRIPNSSVRTIATIYQNLAAESVSDYGARVDAIYRDKLWQKKKK